MAYGKQKKKNNMGLGIGINSSKYDYTLESAYVSQYNWDFDGTNDAINCGNSSEIKLTTTDTSEGTGMSVALWCKADDWNDRTGTKTLISCFQNSGGWDIAWNGRIRAQLRSNNATRVCQTAFKPFESPSDTHYRASGWHHIAITFDGRYFKMYIDGALGSNINEVDLGDTDNAIQYTTSPTERNTDVCIGADPGLLQSSDGGVTFPSGSATLGNFWQGLINEAAIWKKALTLAEIQEIYNYTDNEKGVFDVLSEGDNYTRFNDAGGDSLVALWRADGSTEATVPNLAPSSTTASQGTKKNGVADTTSDLPT